MPHSGLGTMQGSPDGRLPSKVIFHQFNGHIGAGHTHNVTQRTDTHIFTGGDRTHNVTQRADAQIFLTH